MNTGETLTISEVIGFEYTVEHIRDGKVLSTEVVKNLVPTEGLNHILSVVMAGGSPYASWNIGLFEGNYTPTGTITAATLPAQATEMVAYTETTRRPFTPGSVAAGAVNNAASKAQFTFNANKTVYGGFISSSSAKNSVTGVLLSVVRFASPKVLESGDVLSVTAGMTLTSS
jgi:hypothetical protein